MPEIKRNGVRLAYTESGVGGPPMLFVHGWGGRGTHFAAQMEHFKRSRRVVAVDRRGHGASDKPEGPYDIPQIAEEVVFTSRELGLAKPVLVVHSQGVIGLEAVAQAPDFASALVVLDAPVFPPPEVRAGFEQFLQGLKTPGYKDAIDYMCDSIVFIPTDDKTRRARLHAELLETPQQVLAATWERFLAYDPLAALPKVNIPVLYVGGVMPHDEARMRAALPQIMIGRTVGAGHFHQLEVPGQVNAMIDRFLEVNRL